MTGHSFSDVDDDILLQELSNRPPLWQVSNIFYKDPKVRSDMWIEIADKVGKSDEQCKKRWRNIKDTYERKRKAEPIAFPSRKGKKWALEDKLHFLTTGHTDNMSQVQTIQQEDVDNISLKEEQISLDSLPRSSSPNITTSMPSPQNTSMQYPVTSITTEGISSGGIIMDAIFKRKGELRERTGTSLSEDKEDDVDLFFRSLAKSVKKMTPMLQQQAKAETLNIIMKLETEMWK